MCIFYPPPPIPLKQGQQMFSNGSLFYPPSSSPPSPVCVAWLRPNVDSVELPARGASAWPHMAVMRKGRRAALAVSGVARRGRGRELAAPQHALPETPLPLETPRQPEPAQGAFDVLGQTVRKTLQTGAGIWTHGYTHP